MRLAFFVNDVATEIDEYTTTRLARAAAQSGHEVWYVGVGDVALGESDGQLVARAHAAEFDKDDTLASFMERIKERDAERIVMDDLDALFLRNESIDDLQERPWASPLGVVFGHKLKARGVTVVNDPMSLIRATSKLYLEEFPGKIRPRSLVTRDPEAIRQFVSEVGHSVVKPLYGAKGRNVFMIEDEGEANLAQMTAARSFKSSSGAAKTAMPGSSCSRDRSSSAAGSWPPSAECPRVTIRGPTSAQADARSPSRSVTRNAASSKR